NGIFAFAIYDRLHNKILLCRDRFGVKPLYYSFTEQGLIVASEIKAILKVCPKDFNMQAIYDYLKYGLIAHNNQTFFEGIYSLEAAHLLEYDLISKKAKKIRYWDLPDDNTKCVSTDEEEVLSKTYSMLRDAMRLNMVSDVEVAVSLSSGTDSTLLLKLAQERSTRIKAFTFGFEESNYDEVRRIREETKLRDVEWHTVYMKRSEMLPTVKEAIYYFETPIGGVGTLSAYNMMKEVHRQNIKVMLSGEGSDESFGGYRYYFPAFFKDVEHDSNLLKNELEAYSLAHGHRVKPFSQEYHKMIALIDKEAVLAPDGTGEHISHESKALKDIVRQTQKERAKRFSGSFKQIMYDDLVTKKLPKLLHFQDRAGMANSVETRVPYLDHRLVTFIYSLPETFKIRQGQSKYLIRKILKDIYGCTHTRKTKHYVATPQREWLRTKAICDQILGIVKEGRLKRMNLVDLRQFEKDYLKYVDSRDLGNSFFVWKIINLEYFLNQKWI
ncbi:MAG: asparagine synthase (glutamine-hydrolyzing), partial [Candidatus Omnitrophica bacterium]|nr:asparagine synthase (glutamine-hydrolyzing) [Candidatus Omnitrophota bacterium]